MRTDAQGWRSLVSGGVEAIIAAVFSRPRRGRFPRLLAVNILVLAFALFLNRQTEHQSIQLAVAKGKQLLDMPAEVAGYPAEYLADLGAARAAVEGDAVLGARLAQGNLMFLAAVPLTAGETIDRPEYACGRLECVLVTMYDFASQMIVEAVVHSGTGEIRDKREVTGARPAGTSEALAIAMDIAAADSRVIETLGQIGAADPAMIPMSGWLSFEDCSKDWCVDLTFHDPEGSGRIFHVFVNMDQGQVARTFFTRARADRSLGKPLAQRDAFVDGCHDQYGWQVCWEMTANDGINFQDASFGGREVFASAKIGQIEAWYPSWPGGYRDEIGFAASVPPLGGTEIVDLGNGFEVRQIFTEFTRWPNCICCYRYEQAVAFFDDGAFDLDFVSHGPGCDDLSIYRPFWRIDLDLNGGDGDEVWLWDENQWVEGIEEFETFPIVDDQSPEGHKLATFDGDLHYRWTMEPTDPLELDEGYFFLLAKNEGEGDGPIATGPGDTFIPPRQWIDGEALSGNDIVLWFVPLLKTKKGGPWWCMPDPEPEFSPCAAVLHAVPAGELRQPTPEELATLQPAEPADDPATATPIPTPQPTAAPRMIEGDDAETLFLNAGCTSCHQIGALGEAHKVGPDLTFIGEAAGGRVPGMTAMEYVSQSILWPNAYLAPECPNGPCLPSIMPGNYGDRLSTAQVAELVDFLLAQNGPEPTPLPIGSSATEASPTLTPKAVSAGKFRPEGSSEVVVTAALAVSALLVVLVLTFSIVLLLRR